MTTTLTPDQQQIIQIAERYNAHPGSTLTIRGIEDVLEFADEVQGLALEQVETAGVGKIDGMSSCIQIIAKALTAMPEIKASLAYPITDPAKIHEVFEHDQQCDDMAGVPSASIT